MKLNRRNFLISSSTTLIGAFALANFPKSALAANSDFALQNANSFSNLLGSTFTLYQNDSAIESVLTEVKRFAPKNPKSLNNSNSSAKMNSFCLSFSVFEDNLPQDYYQIFHPSLGLFHLLLVPGINQKNQPVLTAVINRL